MPINTDLNISPYFDDFDVEKQFYKILFKPAYAVQARELTQLQTILQNQVEQFGDNIFQDGSIVKGCNFTELNGLQFVKVNNPDEFDIDIFRPKEEVATDLTGDPTVDVSYELEETATGIKANIIFTERGFETRAPNQNTFFIRYIGTSGSSKQFTAGNSLTITKKRYNGGTLVDSVVQTVTGLAVTTKPVPVGNSFGIQAAPGIIFQKGHFLFASEQTLIISKYDDQPDGVSVGYQVKESLISAVKDGSLYDNANGSSNENAPGADRLKLVPELIKKTTAEADLDATFFTLARYKNGNAVLLRDVSKYNVLGEEMAKRTYEESGDYIVKDFAISTDRRDDNLKVLIGQGSAYIKGYRMENRGDQEFTIEPIANTVTHESQSVSIDYGNWVPITTGTGNNFGVVDLGYNLLYLQNSSGTNIGEAYARNITNDRLYLFNVKMTTANTSFQSVDRIQGDGGTIYIDGDKTVLQEAKKAPNIYDTGMFSIKSWENTDIIVRETVSISGISNDTVDVGASEISGDDFSPNQDDMCFVDASNNRISITSYSKTVDNETLTLNFDPADGVVAGGTLYVNTRHVDVSPIQKQAKTVFVKANFTGSSNKTKYDLGFPDVFEILEVKDTNGVDYKDSFRLRPNQKDGFYDRSYIEFIQGRNEPTSGTLTIKMRVFQATGSGSYFFTIGSYPIDDTTDLASMPDSNIRSWQVPVYTASNGKIYNMRECVDFRPHVDIDSNVGYGDTTAASAGTVSAAVGATTPVFSRSDYVVPALKSNVISDIEQYYSRVDSVTLDSFGNITLVKGAESETPVPPKVGADQMVISEIVIPGFPALSQKEAADQRKFGYAIRARSKGTKAYTMRDIEKIERRIEGMEYYISLNQLEQSVENLLVLDEDGNTRFKNGYIADPFKDLQLANLDDTNYSAAVQFNQEILTPAVKTFPIDLKFKSGGATNATIFPDTEVAEIGTLSRNAHIELLSQPYATNTRNAVSNFWKFNGQGEMSPDHDFAQDTVTNPVRLDIDLATPLNDFVENLQEIFPLTDTEWGQVSGQLNDGGTTRWDRWLPTQVQDGVINTLTTQDTTSDQRVGDFVSNFQFQPFIRSREIRVRVGGLRPNTEHYFFFDGVKVNQHVRPGSEAGRARDVGALGDFNGVDDGVETNDDGRLYAIFTIPEETFYVGERVLTIVDVDQFSDIESSATSKIKLRYRAYNISVEKSALTATTRSVDFDIDSQPTSRNLPQRLNPDFRPGDPLAQTFFIKKGMGEGTNSVMISKIDLYFKRKSDTNGLTVMLREVINGYPSHAILPFSKVFLDPSDVQVSDDASAVTTVTFNAPVRMDVEKEYAVVIMPDGNDPNYLVYTSKVGGTDITPGATNGQAVVQDWGDGVLFTSTNNRAWTAEQDEDIKFALYRHDFNESAGSITMTHNDSEFFTLADWDGRFQQGEFVYQIKPLSGSTVEAMTVVGSTVTASSGVLGDTYAVGDYILIQNAGETNEDIYEIISIDTNTTMTIERDISFSDASKGNPVVAGKVSYYNKFNPSELHLTESSATASKVFSNTAIIGLTSGVEGEIDTVDNINLSYVQPVIQKANDNVTTTSLSVEVVPPSDENLTYKQNFQFGANNKFNQGVVVYSKSNDPTNSKKFDFKINMTNGDNDTSSPIVDLETAVLLAYQYKATNSAATTSKYISKTIELEEDLDAEDMEIFLTGYRPPNTDIKVYIRPQNVYDAQDFYSLPWIELEIVEGERLYSSAINPKDYKEYKYRVANANKNGEGVLSYVSADGSNYFGYRRFAIRIDLIADDIHQAPAVKDYRGIALT